MHPELETLQALEVTDREIRRLKEEIALLPRRVAVIEEKLAGTKVRLEKAKGAAKADEAAKRQHEANIQAQQQKISKYRDQSLEVKTNDQYRALQHEIEFAQQEIRGTEDRILELMVASEAREKDIRDAEAELKEETREIEKEQAEARARTEVDQRELEQQQARRTELRSGVKAALLEHYDRVLQARGNALAEVRDQKCSACNVMLRPQKYDEVRAGQELLTCDSCGRILFHDPAHDTPEPAPSRPRKRKSRTETETPDESSSEGAPAPVAH
jgi:predicted  nucleic acid-binding Zn-ribbon protein